VANYTTLETRSIFNSAIDKNGTELLLTNETAPLWMNAGKVFGAKADVSLTISTFETVDYVKFEETGGYRVN